MLAPPPLLFYPKLTLLPAVFPAQGVGLHSLHTCLHPWEPAILGACPERQGLSCSFVLPSPKAEEKQVLRGAEEPQPEGGAWMGGLSSWEPGLRLQRPAV